MADPNNGIPNEDVNGKVDKTIDRMAPEKREEILSSFDKFTSYLGNRIDLAKRMGLDDEQIAKAAEKVANYLAEHEDPKNREEMLLKQLWNAGDKEQQHTLAHLLVNMAQNENERLVERS